jgi:hypothetical protein
MSVDGQCRRLVHGVRGHDRTESPPGTAEPKEEEEGRRTVLEHTNSGSTSMRGPRNAPGVGERGQEGVAQVARLCASILGLVELCFEHALSSRGAQQPRRQPRACLPGPPYAPQPSHSTINSTCRPAAGLFLKLRTVLLGAMLLASCGATSCRGNSTKLAPDQCRAWMDFYDSTNGDSWTGGVTACTQTDPCSCFGSWGETTYPVCDPTGTTVHQMWVPHCACPLRNPFPPPPAHSQTPHITLPSLPVAASWQTAILMAPCRSRLAPS